MRTDEDLLKETTHILKHDAGLDAANIDVTVAKGVITLTGTVHSAIAKWMAKEAVKHINGIKGINEKLEVKPFYYNIEENY